MEPIIAIAIGMLIVLIIIVLFCLLLSRQARYLFSEFVMWLMFWR